MKEKININIIKKKEDKDIFNTDLNKIKKTLTAYGIRVDGPDDAKDYLLDDPPEHLKELIHDNQKIIDKIPILKHITDILGPELVNAIYRMNKYNHIITPLAKKEFSDYLKNNIIINTIFNLNLKSFYMSSNMIEKSLENITEEDILKTKDALENIIRFSNEVVAKLTIPKVDKNKTIKDVKSDMNEGSILWHMDRREQGIPKEKK